MTPAQDTTTRGYVMYKLGYKEKSWIKKVGYRI